MGTVAERAQAAPGWAARARRKIPVLVAIIVFAAILAPLTNVSGAEQQVQAEVYFDRTSQTLGGPFYDAWLAQGGLQLAGEPVSPAIQDGNRWMQWFASTRLEIPTSSMSEAPGDDTQAATIGSEIASRLGFARWHPAFQPFTGQVAPGVRSFATGHTLANAFRETWEHNGAGERLGPPISEEFRIGDTTYQFFERGALSWSPDLGVNVVPLGYFDAAMHGRLRLNGERPQGIPSYVDGVGAAPHGPGGEKWIDINLSTYILTAYEGDTPVFRSTFVDGAPETPTITGSFRTYWKLDKQTMEGPNADGSEYRTEDVPWVMYFFQDFAVHGAYWRSSFGYSGSHGCVNLPVGDAAWLYGWAPVGTRVEVHR